LALLKIQSKIVENRKMTPAKDLYFAVNREMESEIIDLYPELLGRKPEEKISLKRTYPADFRKKIWAGKEVEHSIEVKSIFELKKPVLDADFLKSVSISGEEEFRKKLREEFDHHAEHKKEDTDMKFIFDRLDTLIQFPVPKSLVDREIARQLSENRRPLKFRDDEEKEKFKQLLIRNAEKSVKIVQEDIDREYRHLAEHNHLAEKDVRKYYGDKEKLEQLKDQLMDAKVIRWIKEKVKIKEV
jgi:FKBP-type peptidyl-prolyl cis-trans isomerase (trigger factor)